MVTVEDEKVETKKVYKRYCDVCGTRLSNMCTIHCYVCSKDLCRDCGIKVSNEHYYSDYPDWMCEDCLKVRRKYEETITYLEDKLDYLNEMWESEAEELWNDKKEEHDD